MDFWISQVTRYLCDAAEGFLIDKPYLIHDRDPLFTAEFLETLATSGVQPVKLPPRSPNLNVQAERVVKEPSGTLPRVDDPVRRGLIAEGHASIRGAL